MGNAEVGCFWTQMIGMLRCWSICAEMFFVPFWAVAGFLPPTGVRLGQSKCGRHFADGIQDQKLVQSFLAGYWLGEYHCTAAQYSKIFKHQHSDALLRGHSCPCLLIMINVPLLSCSICELLHVLQARTVCMNAYACFRIGLPMLAFQPC